MEEAFTALQDTRDTDSEHARAHWQKAHALLALGRKRPAVVAARAARTRFAASSRDESSNIDEAS